MRKIGFLITIAAISAYAGTTNVRIYHQAVASPASVQSKQIGVNTSADANLGYKMWFGKDADGNITQFLAKDKNARMLSVRQDSSFSKVDTAWKYKGDTAFIGGLKATRLYFGLARGDTTRSIYDTAKIMKADSGDFLKLHIGKLVQDTSNVEHLLNLAITSKVGIASGDIWNDSSEAAFENFSNGIKGTFNRCLFAQQQIMLDSNSTSEVSLIGTDSAHGWYAGSDSLPANWFRPGKHLRFSAAGIYSSKATSPGTLIMRVKLNNTLIDSSLTTLDANEDNSSWRMDGAIVCRTAGVSGSVMSNTDFNHSVLSGGAETIHSVPAYTLGTTVNTTIKQRFGFTAQFGTADAANKIRSIIFYLEEIH